MVAIGSRACPISPVRCDDNPGGTDAGFVRRRLGYWSRLPLRERESCRAIESVAVAITMFLEPLC